ncbi:MAG: nitrogen fixation protein NifZ [Lachnospiraceae bacterium]|nr:nitrogen fixation protein NifZ [Lachnospiraceae bacterium]
MSDVNIQDQNNNGRTPAFEMNESVMTNRGKGVVKDIEFSEEEQTYVYMVIVRGLFVIAYKEEELTKIQ